MTKIITSSRGPVGHFVCLLTVKFEKEKTPNIPARNVSWPDDPRSAAHRYKKCVDLPDKSVTFSNSANRKGKTKPRENFILGCQQRSLNRPILGLSHFVKLSNNPWNAVKGNRSLLYILLCHPCRHHVIQHPPQQMQHGTLNAFVNQFSAIYNRAFCKMLCLSKVIIEVLQSFPSSHF